MAEYLETTLSVSQDLTGNKYYLMKVGASDNSALLQDTADAYCVGVLQEKIDGSTNVKDARIRTHGRSFAVAGAAVSLQAQLRSDANGKVVTADAADDKVIGYALTAAAADDDVIEVMLQHSVKHA